MLSAEPYLLESVVDALRTALVLDDRDCNVEHDADFVPQTAGDLYVAVSPDGLALGRHHAASGGVFDFVFGCRVTVYVRSRNMPRDKRRNLYLDQVKGINHTLDKVIRAIDWNQQVILATNANIRVQEPNAGGLIHPLSLVSVDAKPRTVVGEVYGASVQSAMGADTYVGLARGVGFANARRMEVKP